MTLVGFKLVRAWGIAFLESKRKRDFMAALKGQRYPKDKNWKIYFVWVGICLKLLQFFYSKHCNQECHVVIERESGDGLFDDIISNCDP